jgi:hypothetical protein
VPANIAAKEVAMDDDEMNWAWSEAFREKVRLSNETPLTSYAGAGRCIYCFEGKDEALSDEHAIPFSLGGNSVIENASCEKCKLAIEPVDRHIARTVFGQHRVHAGIQTRRPKERPTKLPADFLRQGKTFSAELPIAEHPYSVTLPVWGSAGFFKGARKSSAFPGVSVHGYHWTPPGIRETLQRIDADGSPTPISLPKDFRLDLFGRAIAKIAYCNALMRYGLDAFSGSGIQDVIVGKDPAVPFFVGGVADYPPPPFDRTVLHFVSFNEIDLPDKTARRLIVMNVRLFSNSGTPEAGMPIYHAVMGTVPLEVCTRPVV